MNRVLERNARKNSGVIMKDVAIIWEEFIQQVAREHD